MLYNDYYIENLVGFKDIILKNVKNYDDEIHLYVEMKVKKHNCPRCNSITKNIHDYRMQPIKDIPMFGKKVYLKYRKRRYVCKRCGKRFYEKSSFSPRYHRMSLRLVKYIVNQMRKCHSIKSIASECNVTTNTVFRVFRYINYPKAKLPKVLSIDEFKGNAEDKKYQCILTDPKNKKVLDILKGREERVLSEYFRSFKDRSKVKYFVMDMWKPYKQMAETYFKDATIVIDKYHFIRQVIWAFERVRKEEQKKFIDGRRKYFKRSWFLLLKRMRNLEGEEIDKVDVMLLASRRLQEAYLLKEKFYDFVDSN